jgi:hypothetical protein
MKQKRKTEKEKEKKKEKRRKAEGKPSGPRPDQVHGPASPPSQTDTPASTSPSLTGGPHLSVVFLLGQETSPSMASPTAV